MVQPRTGPSVHRYSHSTRDHSVPSETSPRGSLQIYKQGTNESFHAIVTFNATKQSRQRCSAPKLRFQLSRVTPGHTGIVSFYGGLWTLNRLQILSMWEPSSIYIVNITTPFFRHKLVRIFGLRILHFKSTRKIKLRSLHILWLSFLLLLGG